jgi:predicted phage terminase large subunit-like protein
MTDILSEILGITKDENKVTGDPQSDKERCRYNFLEFTKTYLWDNDKEDWDSLCEFHFDIANRLEEIVLKHRRQKTHTCYVSPRGHQKSFWTTYAFPIWCIAYGHTKNILIVTSEGSLGRQFIIDIMQFIETNEKFINDFGNLKGDVIWTRDKIACSNGSCVSCKGSEMATRGVKILGVRPEVIICDDILSEKNSSNSDQRQKLYDWYNKVLMPCGEKYCSIFVIGTILNDACLLYKMLTDPQFSDYYTKKYQAVIEYSDSPLWDEWLNIRNDLSNSNRSIDADKFYLDNKEEMIKGTKVLWDRFEDTYLFLMKEKQRIGDDAWATEMMNDGLLEESREIKEDWITRNFYIPEEMPKITDAWIGIDAAATAKRKSDDSAIVVLGKGEDKFFYILETFSRKVPIDVLIDQMIIYAIQYFDILRAVRTEDVVFQILLKDLMERKARDHGLYLPFDPIKPPQTKDKEFKLRSLIMPIRNNYIKFSRDQRKLLEEMRRFPKGSSDNLLDALWLATHGVFGGDGFGFSFGGVETPYSLAKKNTKQPDWLTNLRSY